MASARNCARTRNIIASILTLAIITLVILAVHTYDQVTTNYESTLGQDLSSDTNDFPWTTNASNTFLSDKDAFKLYRQKLSFCVARGTTVSPEVETNVHLRRNLQCWCAEISPPDNRNCLFRLNNAIIHKRFAKPARRKTVIYVHSPSLLSFSIYVEAPRSLKYPFTISGTETPIEIRGMGADFQKYKMDAIKTARSAQRLGKKHIPIVTSIRSPVLLLPDAFDQDNFYHAIVGPSGLLQIVSTRAAINRFYTELNDRLANSSGRLSLRRDDVDGEYNRNFSDPIHSPRRLEEFALGSSLDDDWDLARCHQMPNITIPAAPPSYLAKEILFNSHTRAGVTPGTKEVYKFFASQFGFCQHLIPSYSHTFVEGEGNDLWIGKLFSLAGWLDDVRRDHQQLLLPLKMRSSKLLSAEPQKRIKVSPELIADPLPYVVKDQPVPILMDEFTSMCPLSKEESIGARESVRKVESVLSQDLPSEINSVPRCTKVSRTGADGTSGEYCAFVSGRPIYPSGGYNIPRTRGLPTNIEIAILNALLMPLDGVSAPLSQTPIEEQKESKWWHLTPERRNASCHKNDGIREREILPSAALSADARLDALNYGAGLAPCEPPTSSQVIADRSKYPDATDATHMFEGLSFNRSSRWFDTDSLQRVDLSKHSLKEQYAGIQAANLFIFEEGASATWSMFAPHGSTFIIVYSNNYKRVDTVQSQVEALSELKNKWLKPQWITMPPMDALKAHTEHFLHQPYITGNVRMIFLIYQDGRLPSFARLREVFDWPWKPESIFIGCECSFTRVAPFRLVHGKC